jgi:hypothetical protein
MMTSRTLRFVVVAHTHWARIVAGRTGPKHPSVLLDAGAWIGRCRIRHDQKKPIQNGQIGVLASNDLRVYQVGWRAVGG